MVASITDERNDCAEWKSRTISVRICYMSTDVLAVRQAPASLPRIDGPEDHAR